MASRGSDARILLVEDEPGVRNAMRTLAQDRGLSHHGRATAGEAIALLRDGGFDLLITDYHLESGRTGTQVIAAARELLGSTFKAILVTGDTSAAIREMQGDAHLRIASKPSIRTNCWPGSYAARDMKPPASVRWPRLHSPQYLPGQEYCVLIGPGGRRILPRHEFPRNAGPDGSRGGRGGCRTQA